MYYWKKILKQKQCLVPCIESKEIAKYKTKIHGSNQHYQLLSRRLNNWGIHYSPDADTVDADTSLSTDCCQLGDYRVKLLST